MRKICATFWYQNLEKFEKVNKIGHSLFKKDESVVLYLSFRFRHGAELLYLPHTRKLNRGIQTHFDRRINYRYMGYPPSSIVAHGS